jgi:hypothetical protein
VALSGRLTRPALELVAQARRSLQEACEQSCPADRYAAAHLAALRAAAAVLAARALPATSVARRRPTSAWVTLTSIAPELGEWASYFAAGSGKRAAAEAGSATAVTSQDADGLVRDVDRFLVVVEATLRSGTAPSVAWAG